MARAYVRAIGGGLLLGLPLLFTQEMWSHASAIPSWKILVLLVVAAGIVLGFNVISGFRRDRSMQDVVIDSAEALGLGIVLAAVALLLLGRIDTGSSLRDAAGMIALEAVPIAFGASIARAELGVSDEGGGRTAGSSSGGLSSEGRVLVGAGGALVFALNVAPTQEPVLLGVELDWWLLLLVMAATFVVTFALVFFAEFRGPHRPPAGKGVLGSPLAETFVASAVSLTVAFGLLWAFGRIDGAGLVAIAGPTVTLGVVASFGAAVGRVLIRGGETAA